LVTLKYQQFLGDNKAYARDNESENEQGKSGESEERMRTREMGDQKKS
jgi:hypothetical protein